MASIRKTNQSITRKITAIENAVKTKLLRFYNRKIKPNSQFPIETFRDKYEREVKTIIRKTIQDAYLTGTDVVNEKITDKNKSFQLFISGTDIRNIQELTDKMNDQFWVTAGKLLRREQEFVFNTASQELEKKKSFDAEAALIGISALISFKAFNTAVVSKTSIVGNSTAFNPINISDTGITFDFDVEFGIDRLPDELPLEGKVMFLTQEDAKVDPEICEPENRQIYDVNDPLLPEPPLHRFCRCRLIPIVEPAVDLGTAV